MAGGLSAVIWTDFVQTVLMIIGAFILTGIGETKTANEIALKPTDVRLNKLLLVCNEEVLMWLVPTFLCNQITDGVM